MPDARVFHAAEREDDGAAHGGGFVFREGEDGVGVTDQHHALDRAVADVFVLVVVLFDDGHERGNLFFGAEFADGDGGEHAGAEVGILEKRGGGIQPRLVASVAEGLHGLATDFGIGIRAKFHERLRSLRVRFQTGEISESPYTVEAGGERFGRMGGG